MSSGVVLEWPFLKLSQAGATDTTHVFVVAELTSGDRQISRNLTYLAPTKQIHLKPATLTVDTIVAGGKTHVRVSSPVLARSVYLSFDNLDVKVSDNYFDLLPGETADIVVDGKASLDEVKSQLHVMSLTDAFAVNPQTPSMAAAH